MSDVPVSLLDHLTELNRSSTTPLYEQLCAALRKAIANGELPRGSKLPSSRFLKTELGISRNTVIEAYEQLESEGYLESHVGSGTYISEQLPEQFTEIRFPSSSPSPPKSERRPQSVPTARTLDSGDAPSSFPEFSTPYGPFQPGLPDLNSFPIETWSNLISRRWRSLPPQQLRQAHPAGYGPLREAVAVHLQSTRGLRCGPQQVVIVSGRPEAFSLVGRILLDSDCTAYVDDPGPSEMHTALSLTEARLRSLPVTNHERDLSVLKHASPSLIGLTPSHPGPLPATMAPSQRTDLLEWATRNGTWIVEHDSESIFRYAGQPIAALQGIDTSDSVLHVGTFNNLLFPALNIGYLVVPPDLVKPIRDLRAALHPPPPRVSQMVLADFIEEGHLQSHIRKVRTLYSSRQRTLLKALDDQFESFIDVDSSQTGLHLVGRLPEDIDDQTISDRLANQDITAPPLSQYALRPLDQGGLLFGFASSSESEIRNTVRRMATTLSFLAS